MPGGYKASGGVTLTSVDTSIIPSAAGFSGGADLGTQALFWEYVYGGHVISTSGLLTVGAMSQGSAQGGLRVSVHEYTWTNAQVVALGAVLAGDILVCTMPAKTIVVNAYVIVTGQGAGTTTLTVALGRTAAGYIDYIVASNAKAAANTVYGDVVGERGTNLTGYDLPSYTGTTAVNAHFVTTVENLDQVTGSTGRVILFTALSP